MQFDRGGVSEIIGVAAGYIFSYFFFTTMMFFILNFTNKIPSYWTYFHIMGITICISLTGFLIRRLLK